MNYEVLLTETAKNDLKSIYSYIAFDLKEKTTALNLIKRLEKQVYGLSDTPERFRRYESDYLKNRNIRIMPFENYLIIYEPDKNDLTVTVLRVAYGKRNLTSITKNI